MTKRKVFAFPVRDSGWNPFLTNPIHVVMSDPNCFGRLLTFYLNHAFECGNGLYVSGRWADAPDGVDTVLRFEGSGLQIANLHEAERFEYMLRMLGISFKPHYEVEVEYD